MHERGMFGTVRKKSAMTAFLTEYMNVLLMFLPVFCLLLYPMWPTRNVKTGVVVILVVAGALYLCAALLFYKQMWSMTTDSFQIFKMLAGLPVLAIPFIIFRERIWPNFFAISVTYTYCLISNGMGTLAWDIWFVNSVYPMLGASFISLLVIVITLPVLLIILRRLYENPHMEQAVNIWKLIWLLPSAFFWIILITNSYVFSSVISIRDFIVIRTLAFCALALVCFLLDESLRQVGEAEKARQEARALAAKTELLRIMSHKLRTPLTIISTNIQTVHRRPHESKKLLEDSQAEIMKLAAMIENIMNESDIQHDKGDRQHDKGDMQHDKGDRQHDKGDRQNEAERTEKGSL